MEFVKLRVTAYWGPLVILDRGREGILFTCSQVTFGWSQNNFNTQVGFTLTLDRIHGTRGVFTVKLTSEYFFETRPVLINNWRFNIEAINRDRTKNAFHKLRNIWSTCFKVRIIRKITKRIQVNLFCNTVFAVLVHVNCVNCCSENDTWKVNIELNKHYVGIRTSSGASIIFFGTALSRVLT